MEGLILAGGRSSRMGRDKALLPVGEVPLLRRLAEQMSAHCERIWIACGTEERAAVYATALGDFARERGEGFLRFVPDRVGDCGPLSGLEAALAAMPDGSWAFTMACDMPRLSKSLLARMRAAAEAADLEGRDAGAMHAAGQPMHALYHTRALPVVRAQLASGDYRMMQLLGRMDRVTVELESDEEREAFRNLNTPEEWAGYAVHGEGDAGV